MKTNQLKLSLVISAIFTMSGCASLVSPNVTTEPSNVKVNQSYLEQQGANTTADNDSKVLEAEKAQGQFTRLNRLSDNQQSLKLEIDLSKQFNDKKTFQVSVNALPLNDFLHYTLGELLQVSTLIEPSVKTNATPVTLELKEKVSAKRLFQLVQQILGQHKIDIALNDDLFYVYPLAKGGGKSDIAFGFGAKPSDVPQVSGNIRQLIPIKYGVSTGLRSTIASLIDANVGIDPAQGMMNITGRRDAILRGLSLLELLDSKLMKQQAIGLFSFEYLDSETFVNKVKELLTQEGISANSGRTASSSVRFIPIEHLGQVIVFASADEILDRVEYWHAQLDKPATGSEQSFYIYHPKFARAADLGQSLAPLIGGQLSGNSSANTKTNAAASTAKSAGAKSNSAGNANNASQSIEGENMRLVVDERSNALIFYSSGKHYQELQPIIRQLDVMPKQIMLEVMIAEVTLTGSFAKGVEFALKNGPSGTKTENFSYKGKEGFGYSVVGLNGTINVNFNQTDGLVNVLSRPTILVRDGVSANISVGDDIPTIGSTTSDPINGERQTTTIQYRKTGVDLTVTPTVNAQGTVIMTIDQNISSVAQGSAGSNTPAVFERKLSTEVVAGDGQTVMLGGLISERSDNNATEVPGLGALPVVGHLFRTDSSSRDKTELVVLVTPKIVRSTDDWNRIKQSFVNGLENLKF